MQCNCELYYLGVFSTNEVPIEDYLCLALYRASRAVTGRYRDLLAGLELTYPQYLVMRLLWQRGTVPVRDIGEALGLGYGTLSPLLKRLETAGLVERRRRIDDERSVDIMLTADGEDLERAAADIPNELSCALGLNEEDTSGLRETLLRLTAAVEEPRASG